MKNFVTNTVCKKIKTSVLCLIVCSFLFVSIAGVAMCIETSAAADIYDKVIRFHVIANSDSESDQNLKIQLRDAVLSEFGEHLSGYDSKEKAIEDLSSKITEIEDFSKETIKKLGFDYDCSAVIDTEYYQRTEYEAFTMPAGTYSSLRIVIGEGNGKNWWCVLFPPLCTRAALNVQKTDKEAFIQAGFSGDQYEMITNTDKPKYRLRFRLLELLFG